MKYPNIYEVRALVSVASMTQTNVKGKLVPARPEGYASLRHKLKATWLVFTGRADAVVWPGQ